MPDFSRSVSFNIIRQSIRLDDPAAAIEETTSLVQQNTVDWNELFIYANNHGIKPQVAALLNKMPAHLVPEAILHKLKQANLTTAYRQLSNVAEFFKVKQLLDEAGIPAIPFKGFWLAHHFYGNLADRESVDIDLLIHIADLEKIKPLMRARGYIPEAPLEELTSEYIINELCEYNFNLYDGNTRVFHIEFHWRISLAVYAMNISLADLAPQIITGELQQKQLPVFSDSANLLLTIMHHAGKDQFFQLKQILDIGRILQKQPYIDWAWLIAEAKRFDVELLVYVAVRLAARLTAVEIPGEIYEQVNSVKIGKLADNRLKMIREPPQNWNSWRHDFGRWQFLVKSREGKKLKMTLFKNIIFKDLLPRFVPKKIHYLFLNNKIRVKSV